MDLIELKAKKNERGTNETRLVNRKWLSRKP